MTGQCRICGKRAYARGLCKRHYEKQRRFGDPEYERSYDNYPTGEDNSHWLGDGAGYYAVHKRLLKERGPASTYPCADNCGHPAQHWSYKEGIGFSTDLSLYEPRCVSCHHIHDDQKRRDAQLQKRRDAQLA